MHADATAERRISVANSAPKGKEQPAQTLSNPTHATLQSELALGCEVEPDADRTKKVHQGSQKHIEKGGKCIRVRGAPVLTHLVVVSPARQIARHFANLPSFHPPEAISDARLL
jgi:hypothetical protein